MSFGEFDECFGEFVDFEGVAFAGDPVGVGTEVAVHLAEVGEHDLHEVCELAVGEPGSVDAGHGVVAGAVVGGAFLDVGRSRTAPTRGRWQEDVVGGHLAELGHLGPAVGALFDEHGVICMDVQDVQDSEVCLIDLRSVGRFSCSWLGRPADGSLAFTLRLEGRPQGSPLRRVPLRLAKGTGCCRSIAASVGCERIG